MNHCAIFIIDQQTIWTAAGAIVALVFACLVLMAAARRA